MAVYCFSATGNSLYVASILAGGDPIINLVETAKRPTIDNDDTIVVVFPLYDFKPPELLYTFLEGLSTCSKSLIYLVATCGIAPFKAFSSINERLPDSNLPIAGGYSVLLPHNGVGGGLLKEKAKQLQLSNATARAHEIKEAITQKETGHFDKTSLFHMLFISPFRSLWRGLPELMWLAATKGFDALTLQSDERCVGCNTCAEICPVDNLTVVDKKVIYDDHCLSCFGCVNWCPQKAITMGGYTIHVAHYHHPQITAKDMKSFHQSTTGSADASAVSGSESSPD